MKKILSFFVAALVSAMTFAATYTVAGSATAVLGTSWDEKNTANDMVLMDGVYTLVKKDVMLAAGDIKYKVCKDHSWDVSYPKDDATYNISEPGKYDITFTFDESTQKVGASAVKKEAIEVVPVITLHGNFSGSWKDTETFQEAGDKKSASLTLTIAKARTSSV